MHTVRLVRSSCRRNSRIALATLAGLLLAFLPIEVLQSIVILAMPLSLILYLRLPQTLPGDLPSLDRLPPDPSLLGHPSPLLAFSQHGRSQRPIICGPRLTTPPKTMTLRTVISALVLRLQVALCFVERRPQVLVASLIWIPSSPTKHRCHLQLDLGELQRYGLHLRLKREKPLGHGGCPSSSRRCTVDGKISKSLGTSSRHRSGESALLF